MAILSADIRTVILLLWMGNLIAVVLLAVHRHSPSQGYPHILFLGARLGQAIAWMLLWLRGIIPDGLSAWLGNTLLFAGWALEALALLSLRQRRRAFDHLYWAAAAASVPVSAALYALSSSNIKTAIASAIPVALFILPALRLTLEKNASPLRRVVGGLYLAFSAATSYRSVVALTSTTTFSLMSPGAVQSFDFLALFWLMLFGAVGYLLLLSEQAGQELLQSEENYRRLNATLAQAVAARTEELQASIGHLEDEISERMRVEAELRRMQISLAARLSEQSQKLTVLYEVILLGGQVLDEPSLMNEILVHLLTAVGGAAAAFYQGGNDEPTLRLTMQQGFPQPASNCGLTLPAAWLPPSREARADLNLAAAPELPPALVQTGFGASLSKWVWFSDHALGVLCVFWPAPRPFSVEEISLFGAVVDQFGVILENGRLRRQVAETVKLDERRRVARDLHDSVTQSLHSLVYSASTARRHALAGQPEKLDQALGHIAESARQALKEMRLLLYELRLAPLTEANLVEAIQTRLETVEQRASIGGQITVEGPATWPAAWESELYPIIMEALNNALKHAHAAQVRVRLRYTPGVEFRLEVSDDGCGFDPQTADATGQGLQNMAARAAKLGGTLQIDSSVGQGTRIGLHMELHG